MDIKTYILMGKSSEELKTEIMFFIACARSSNEDLIKFDVKRLFDYEREERRQNAIIKQLKALKRQGTIQLFAGSDDFNTPTTEIEYLSNKYPSIDKISGEKSFFIIKL